MLVCNCKWKTFPIPSSELRGHGHGLGGRGRDVGERGRSRVRRGGERPQQRVEVRVRQLQEGTRVAHRRLDLGPVPHDRRVLEQALHVPFRVSRDRLRIEAGERVPEGLALAENRDPRQSGLERFEAQPFVQFVAAVQWLIERHDVDGVVNIASPNPLPNAEFMRVLREAYGVPFGLPASDWMLEIGAAFMRTETELVLKSRRVVPARLLENGFTFKFSSWDKAAADLCDEWKRSRQIRRSAA